MFCQVHKDLDEFTFMKLDIKRVTYHNCISIIKIQLPFCISIIDYLISGSGGKT